MRKKVRKNRSPGASANACPIRRAERRNQVWAWDFVYDRTASGTTLKWLSILDEYTRECLTLKVSRSITSEDVINTLCELFAMRGVPECIRSDNGPEFVAKAIQQWLQSLEIETLSIAPGSLWENGCAESFHSKLRDEFLSQDTFENVNAARQQSADWQQDDNEERPHSSLGSMAPAKFAARCVSASATGSASAAPQPPPALQQTHSGITQPILS